MKRVSIDTLFTDKSEEPSAFAGKGDRFSVSWHGITDAAIAELAVQRRQLCWFSRLQSSG
ncbi:MAG: hypothetical protein K6T90_13580 [Leptolyngbyaceae cyanobacterium HOT.MB2.61]|nr:hypothetical protein [Leptolyngbyaceae cyanobacterium HOT.MB2.61]